MAWFLGDTCAAPQVPEELHSGNWTEGVRSNDISHVFCVLQHAQQRACNHHSCERRFQPHATASQPGKSLLLFMGVEEKRRVEYQLSAASLAEQLLCFSSQQTDRCSLQGSWGPVLVCMAGVLYPSVFKVPPGFRRGREGLTCLLQASECHSGKEIIWGDARKQHPPEQMKPPHFTGSLGKTGKPAPSQDVAPRCHWQNKAHFCAQAGFLCGSRMDNEILFLSLAVGEGNRKLPVCSGNESVYILSQAFYYVFINQQKYNRTPSHCVPSDFNIHI